MKTAIALSLALLAPVMTQAASVEDDVNHYVQVFSDTKSPHIEEIDTFAWKGISDPRVFDLIEQHIAAIRSGAVNADSNEINHDIRALGFSGNPKYIPTLNKFIADSYQARYSKIALEDLAFYQKWNPIISDRKTFDAKYSDDDNRLLNMLHSNDFLLKRVAAKRIYFENKDPILLETLASELRASYMLRDSEKSDSIAWMVKALGSAKLSQYRAFIEEVAAQSPDREVVMHAKRVLDHYDDRTAGAK